jgi:propionyl-CoA carboxylase alpha chain
MNTRLQVEHPVTECVTGLDLVEWMIRIAAGEALPFTQDQIRLDGHAIETRFYAEDPYRGFLPSTGRLVRYRQPQEGEGLRIDSGVIEGSEISMFYDPMIAKVITHAPTRTEAADAQVAALDRFHVRGISHNADFLSALMQHPRFRAGTAVTTAFIAEEYPDGFLGADWTATTRQRVIALGAVAADAVLRRATRVDHQLDGAPSEAPRNWVAEIDGEGHPVGILGHPEGLSVMIDGQTLSITALRLPDAASGIVEGEVDGVPVAVQVDRRGSGATLTHAGRACRFRLLTPRAAELARHMIAKVPPDLSRFLLCPMPGLVVSISVAEGDQVEAGQPLAVVEAMKMENILRAEKAGVVKAVQAKPGDSLAVDAVILELE